MKKYVQYFFITSLALFTMNSCEFIRDLTAPKVPVSNKENKKEKALDAEMELRYNIISESKKYIGTNYKYAGKKPSTGFDCSGFTSYCFAQYGESLSSSSRTQAQQGEKIPLSEAKPGDLIFFSRDGKTIMHVALIISNTSEGISVIHSTTSKGVIVQNISKSSYWKPKILFARNVLSQ